MTSLVQFAKEFAKLQSDLEATPTDGLKLTLVAEFYSQHGSDLKKSTHQTYLDELGSVCKLVSEQSLHDLTVEELSALRKILHLILDTSSSESVRVSAKQKLKAVVFGLVKVLCFVGDLERALPIAAELAESPDEPLLKDEIPAGSDSFQALDDLIDRLKEVNSSITSVFADVLDRWQAERECVNDDRALCLLIEENPATGQRRGVLAALQGVVKSGKPERKGEQVADTVTIGNQLRSPDDPFSQVLYNSLLSMRSLPDRFGVSDTAKQDLHAHFSIPGSSGTFTGGSIGFSAGVLTYSQLLKPKTTRKRRFIRSDIAFTGTVEADGTIGVVNQSSLPEKVKRAFFSHLDSLAVPEGNLLEARTLLKDLSRSYPRRNIRLIGYEKLSDALGSHDVVGAEKVCFGEFAAKTVVKYSRATKVQFPLLMILIYALACLIYPPIWIGFDRNPHSVELTSDGFKVFNRNPYPLWSKKFDCEPLDSASETRVHDIDGDGKKEVLFLPATPDNAPCKPRAVLHAYDDDGDSLFAVFCPIIGETPYDTIEDQLYNVQPIEIAESQRGAIIVTQVYASHEARAHFRFWSSSGDLLGWYINAGHMAGVGKAFASDSEGRIYILAYNNPEDCSCLFVIKPDSCSGTSPPRDGFLSDTKPGTQLNYVLFPRTDVSHASGSVYNHPSYMVVFPDGSFRVDIGETDDEKAVIEYNFDKNCRVLYARTTDGFDEIRGNLVDEKKLLPEPPNHSDNLRNSVRYWTDSGWVSEGELRLIRSSAK